MESVPVINPAAASRGREVQTYDFRRPHRVSKDRLRMLEAMFERVTKSLESWLIGRIRTPIELRLRSVEQMSHGEFTRRLPSPCASFVLKINDFNGQHAIIDFGHDLSFYLVDRFFGGVGEPVITDRPLTMVERLAIRSAIDKMADLLSETWSDHLHLSLAVSSFESIPDILLQTANRDDPVLACLIDTNAGDIQSQISVSMPFSALDKFFINSGKQRFTSSTGSASELAANRAVAEQSLRVTSVPVTVQLPAFQVKMRDLAMLQTGNLITTGVSTTSPVRILIGSQERFVASAGKVGNQLAVRLTSQLNQLGQAIESNNADTPHFAPDMAPAPAQTEASVQSQSMVSVPILSQSSPATRPPLHPEEDFETHHKQPNQEEN